MIVDVRNKEEFGVPEYFLSEVDKQVCIVLLSKTKSFNIQTIQAGTHLCDIYIASDCLLNYVLRLINLTIAYIVIGDIL